MDQFIVERVNINQSNVHSRGVWLFKLSPEKQSLLLFSNQPIQLKTPSACVLVAGTQRNFFTSLSRWGTLVSWSSTNQGGPRPCQRKAHFWTCKIRMKQWKTFFTYLSSAFMGSSSLLSSSDSSKSNSLLLGLLFTSLAGMLGFAKKDISLWSLAKTRSRSCLLIIFRSFHRGSSAFWTIRVKPINRD